MGLEREVIVLGGGVAGIGAALELADLGFKVTLFEQNTIGSGASGNNPGRMGHGFHYMDANTGLMYLRSSIQVQRKYPQYLIGAHLPFGHPVRHGRYFITKDSDTSPSKILETYELIKQEYIRLISEDPGNQVFGPPETFYRVLDPSEYQNDVNMSIVTMGIETSEHLFDMPRFLSDIKTVLLNYPRITVYEHSNVVSISNTHETSSPPLNLPRFTIAVAHAMTTGETKTSHYRTNFIVNSTWQNIDKFNNQLGIRFEPGTRSNRLKAMLVVKLPESMHNKNSMFFCMGQHCMYSNMGNGFGMMTYAKETNVEVSSEIGLSERAERLLRGEITNEEKQELQTSILSGVAQYIPEIQYATPVALKFGIVQTSGSLSLQDLKDPNSTFHRRDYDGIQCAGEGVISNPAMKLFYFLRNAKKVGEMMEQEFIKLSERLSHSSVNRAATSSTAPSLANGFFSPSSVKLETQWPSRYVQVNAEEYRFPFHNCDDQTLQKGI